MATWPTITDDDGSNTTGTIVNNTNVWTPIQTYIGGAWTTPTFAAGDYTADSSMTFTVASGDVTTYAYQEIGKTMLLAIVVATASVGGTVSVELRVAVPNGRTIQKTAYGSFHYLDNGTNGTGLWVAAAGLAYVVFRKALSGSNWTLSTNNTYILASVFFEIN